MIYELRVYHCVPGRLPDLLKRFDTITLKLWEKHRIQQAGFWTVGIGSSNQDLYYMLKWETLQEREQTERLPPIRNGSAPGRKPRRTARSLRRSPTQSFSRPASHR